MPAGSRAYYLMPAKVRHFDELHTPRKKRVIVVYTAADLFRLR